MAKRHKKPQRLQGRHLYIRRQSQTDDTQFFCGPNDEPIALPSATWARWFLTTFSSDQKAQVIARTPLPNELPLRDWLAQVLDGVTVDEYMSAVEQRIRELRRGAGPSKAAIRRVLRENLLGG